MLAGSECAGDTTAHDTCQQEQNVCVSVNAGSIMTNVKQQKLLHKIRWLTSLLLPARSAKCLYRGTSFSQAPACITHYDEGQHFPGIIFMAVEICMPVITRLDTRACMQLYRLQELCCWLRMQRDAEATASI